MMAAPNSPLAPANAGFGGQMFPPGIEYANLAVIGSRADDNLHVTDSILV